MPGIRTLDDLGEVRGKRVLVRVDFNVPMKDGEVTDATRIERAATTLRELADRGARVVALSHFGRPKGRAEPSMSLRPLVGPLGRALGGRPVAFAPDCVGPEAERVVDGLKDGDVALVENLRFHAGEEKNDPAFADQLAALGDLYVDDAFSAAHRAHASITGLAERLPAAAGRLMQAEVEALQRALDHPERPVAGLIGGAKVSTKIDVLNRLVDRFDVLIIGGAMANTFLLARGLPVGKSLVERDMADTARDILRRAEARGCEVVLPDDAAVAKEFREGAPHEILPVDRVREDDMILDIGPDTIERIGMRLEGCRTVLWNGPMGAFEVPPFDQGTTGVAGVVARETREGRMVSVAGGGDTVAALAHAGALDALSYVSTAGGAFLEWLEGKELPGVAALHRKT
ncbi:MAG TPA: phosphoglycerate kinase [Geminicoccaceae bacterium]|nr:phosphoglycerate kinase [Geminicoccaceae bacterium]